MPLLLLHCSGLNSYRKDGRVRGERGKYDEIIKMTPIYVWNISVITVRMHNTHTTIYGLKDLKFFET